MIKAAAMVIELGSFLVFFGGLASAEPKSTPTPNPTVVRPSTSGNEASASGALKTATRTDVNHRPNTAPSRENCEARTDRFERAACEQRRGLASGSDGMGR